MAGIGIELKKIYSKNNISNMILGTAYSSMVTVGPTLLIVFVLIMIYSVLGFNYIDVARRELLSTTTLYIFVFSGIITAPINAVFSRYIGDKVYQKKTRDILPSFYTGISVVSIMGTMLAIPVLYRLYTVANVGTSFIIGAYALWMSVVIVFFSVIYIHATKDYNVVFLFYVLGMTIAFATSFALNNFVDIIVAIIWGLAIGFFCIAFLQFAYLAKWFEDSTENYMECIHYLWRFKSLLFANLCYTLGIYAHIFIFWFAEDRVIIASTFLSNPMYDMAACIAMFSNITTTIIFIVMAETEFHDAYQLYMQSVVGGTYRLIQKNKNILFRTLAQQIVRLVVIQSLITSILFLVAITFLPRLYFDAMIIEIYPVLSVGYFILFLMYCIIIYLYYFNDQIGCTVLSVVFLLGTVFGTIYSMELEIQFYGMGLVIGSVLGFACGFFRIRYIERVINKHIFCDKVVVKETKRGRKGHVAYQRSHLYK